MTTNSRSIRRGLPRRPGGDPWPPAAKVETAGQGESMGQDLDEGDMSSPPAATPRNRPVRTGPPRVVGTEPWPPVGAAATAAVASTDLDTLAVPAARSPESHSAAKDWLPGDGTSAEIAVAAAVSTEPADSSAGMIRRGLPRVEGGEPWPPATAIPLRTTAMDESPLVAEHPADLDVRTALPAAPSSEIATAPRTPLPSAVSMLSGTAESSQPSVRNEPKPTATIRARIRAMPRAAAVLLGVIALLILVASVVLLTRAFLGFGFVQDFLTTYPGEYHLPEAAESGFPPWVQWQHFFNVFFMALIIRTGWQVRTNKRPGAFWTPMWSKDGKISLTLWFHQSLDILWLANGIIFVTLLFASGHWMRIVPTSWEVFPNALSALLQYISLDWPTENGWVNYNSLQQLMYFATIFIAAPLAAITGVRMSGLWPERAKSLSQAYPIEWARAVHFPVMLFFVTFIIIHIALVLATGALRNLNHMYGGTDVVNWTGFLIFVGSMVLIVGAWVAARPLVLAPIASLSGRVSGR